MEIALAVPVIIIVLAAALAALVIFRFPDLARLRVGLGFFSLEVWRPQAQSQAQPHARLRRLSPRPTIPRAQRRPAGDPPRIAARSRTDTGRRQRAG